MLSCWFSCPCLSATNLSGSDAEYCTTPGESCTNQSCTKQFDTLQGWWRSELDHRLMGEIKGEVISWDSGVFNQEPTELCRTSASGFEMTLMGALYQATLEDGVQPRLRWNDGEVWVRVLDNKVLESNLLCSANRSCAWDDDEQHNGTEISLSIDTEGPSMNHHPLPHQDSFEFMARPDFGDMVSPRAHEEDFKDRLQLPHMDIWPIPPNCTTSSSVDERREKLWAMYQDFALELYTGTKINQLISNTDYSYSHMQLMDDIQTLKLDQSNGNIIEFPLRNVSKVYRMIKYGDRWRGASNPSLKAVRRGAAEEVVVLQFLRRKVAFGLPTVDETQRFMLCMGLLARRAKEKYLEDREEARVQGITCGPDNGGVHCGPREIACGGA